MPACPICGDPHAYPIWIGSDPPEACRSDKTWHSGGPVTITSVADCPHQRRKAEQAALFRRVAPECFDEAGNMLPGRLADVLGKLPPDTVIYLG